MQTDADSQTEVSIMTAFAYWT